jgi:ribosomal protein S18 acetylase RimI-like enzyme
MTVDLNIKIKDLSFRQLEEMEFKCARCSYWFDYSKAGFLTGFSRVKNFKGLKSLIKGKVLEKSSRKEKRKKIIWFKENGGKVKAAFAGKKCIGAILAGDYYLFPRLREFNVFPPDFDSIFIGCIYVVPKYREMGVDKRLLVELEKELFAEKVKSIESIGKRLNDDIDEEEYYNSPNVPFKFLINNGFYLKKNDPLFPLLRLDMKSIAVDLAGDEKLLAKLAMKGRAESPVIIRNE